MEFASPNNKSNKVHFIGIGGIGTSALARWFLSYKCKVSGSDSVNSEIISELKKQGIKISIGHKAKNLPKDAELVVYSAAVPSNNPEMKKAGKLGIPIKSYAEVLGELSRQYETVCVSGAHGKSTTTALLSLILIKAGLDPTVIIGTKLKQFKSSNFRKGRSNRLLLEADEYNASFLNYSPFAAIILNIDAEHLDFYKNLGNVKKAFLNFVSNVLPGGILVLNKDDKNLFSLKGKIQEIARTRKLKIHWYAKRANPMAYRKLSSSLKVPGEHNVSNALAAYTLAKALGIKSKDILNAINGYHGAWRRMEYKGKFEQAGKVKINVYDDYAHHPTEITTTLSGIARKWPKMGLICVFQPHQAKRLSLLFKAFIKAFSKANALILLPTYQVQGRDKDMSQNVKKLASAIKTPKAVIYLPYPEKLPVVIKRIISSPSFRVYDSVIVVMMGAGDIYKYTKLLIR